MITRNEIFSYVKEKYGTMPDHPFEKSPNTTVLRHPAGKWYALIMDVARNKLGLYGEGKEAVVNVKADPDMIGTLRKEEGILPAYHMNKGHWLTVVLDSPVSKKEFYELIDTSYILTKSKYWKKLSRRSYLE